MRREDCTKKWYYVCCEGVGGVKVLQVCVKCEGVPAIYIHTAAVLRNIECIMCDIRRFGSRHEYLVVLPVVSLLQRFPERTFL